jgi:hypothetical protein
MSNAKTPFRINHDRVKVIVIALYRSFWCAYLADTNLSQVNSKPSCNTEGARKSHCLHSTWIRSYQVNVLQKKYARAKSLKSVARKNWDSQYLFSFIGWSWYVPKIEIFLPLSDQSNQQSVHMWLHRSLLQLSIWNQNKNTACILRNQ